jgi:hypothetical protein
VKRTARGTLRRRPRALVRSAFGVPLISPELGRSVRWQTYDIPPSQDLRPAGER